MLGLQLRREFKDGPGKAMIEIEAAAVVPPAEFLAITYPTTDLLRLLQATGPDQSRPVVLLGERGQGKSHLLATLHHALHDPGAVAAWAADWAERLGRPEIAALQFRKGMQVISSNLHHQDHKFLWDLVFDKHPHGQYIRGKWDQAGAKKTDVPPKALIAELFEKQPTALILDEFQTWYDGLVDDKNGKASTWAFNFVQLLSEIAGDHPESLVLAVSIRSNDSESYRQLHRVNPERIDFKGKTARADRQRLLLHRLFENRMHIGESAIANCVAASVEETLRLHHLSNSEQERLHQEAVSAWPFAPALLRLLEDQVLVSTAAQETRDLISILAGLYRSHGDAQPFLTVADLRVDEDGGGIVALIDSVANPTHATLREKAQRNLESVTSAVADAAVHLPNLVGILSSLWVRSLAAGNTVGALPAELQLDVTRDASIDDNAFAAELAAIVEHSFNIHQVGNRLQFREEDNPDTKLKAHARNGKLFEDGRDLKRIASEARYVFTGNGGGTARWRFLVLPPTYVSQPWCDWPTAEAPTTWDHRVAILILPELPAELEKTIGRFLKAHMQSRRNAVRWLLPATGSINIYNDPELVVLARSVVLAEEWRGVYTPLIAKYQGALRAKLRARWDRLAVLDSWKFQDPDSTRLCIEKLKAQGDKAGEAIEQSVRDNLFVHEEFDDMLLQAATAGKSLQDLLNELQEPRPNGQTCLPWLGEDDAKRRVAEACAAGVIEVNLRNLEILRRRTDEAEENAARRIEGKLPTGKLMAETLLALPQSGPISGGEVQPEPVVAAPVVPTVTTSGGLPPAVVQPTTGGWIGGGFPPILPTSPKTSTRVAVDTCDILTLRAKIKDTYNVHAGTEVRSVVIKTDKLTGAQLDKLIKDLPDGAKYALELDIDDPGAGKGGKA